MNKKLLTVAVSAALVAPMTAQAVKYQMSGQVTRGIYMTDDGVASDTVHAGNGATGSRVTIRGSEDLGGGLKAGFHWEMSNNNGQPVNKQGDTATGTGTGAQNPAFAHGERHMNVWFSGSWGRLTLGQASAANDGASFADLGGNSFLAVEMSCDHATGVAFRNATTRAYTGVTKANVCPSYDGGRTDLIRYDAPRFGPLSIAVSAHNDSAWAARISASGSLGGGAYDVRFGYGDAGGAGNANTGGAAGAANITDMMSVSGSFKFSQGTSVSAMWGSADRIGPNISDPEVLFLKLAHQWGNSSVAIGYRDADDAAQNAICGGGNALNPTCGSTSWGVGFAHTMPKPGIDFAVGYHSMELDDVAAGTNIDDLDLFFVTTRIRFN